LSNFSPLRWNILKGYIFCSLNPLPPSDPVRQQEKLKIILEDLSSSVLSQFKKYHPSVNLKFNDLGTFRSLKLLIIMEKNLSISLKLNVTLTLDCYGLKVTFSAPS